MTQFGTIDDIYKGVDDDEKWVYIAFAGLAVRLNLPVVPVGTRKRQRDGRSKEQGEDRIRKAGIQSVFIGIGVGQDWPICSPPKTILRLGPSRSEKVSCVDEKRRRRTEVRMRLQSIHPNPGPRDKTEEGKRQRRLRRYAKRKEKRDRRQQERSEEEAGRSKDEIKVVAWNVQSMSLEGRWKRRARRVARKVVEEKWDAVLLSEVWAAGKGVLWMGQGEEQVVIIHAEKAAILLRGELLRRWCEGGQRQKVEERTVSVKIDGVVLVAKYIQPRRWGREMAVEEEWSVLGEHVRWAEKEEILIVGGDFNAHVGAEGRRGDSRGKFGLRTSNEAGDELTAWCEENQLCWVNSFISHRARGTWFSNLNRQWYELDGFIMRPEQRHCHTRRMRTVNETALSDHKPKMLVVDIRKKRWRRAYKPRKVPPIR